MDSTRALAHVRSLIRGAIEKENGSPTVVRIFEGQINESIQRLREQFQQAKSNTAPVILWPKMVHGYISDADDMPSPVWGPICDEQGQILGLRVISQTRQGEKRKLRVFIDWASPEL